jgi:IS5 family transposase
MGLRRDAGTQGRHADHAAPALSLHDDLRDSDARPIAKGRPGKPVKFGHQAQFTDNDNGIGLDHAVEVGNPAAAPQLAPAVGRVKTRTGRAPGPVTADCGCGEKRVDAALHDLGVRTVTIPRNGKPSQARRAEEHRPDFERTTKWRIGSEGRIGTLIRGYDWDRTCIDGTEGTRIWTGHDVLIHNLIKIRAFAP